MIDVKKFGEESAKEDIKKHLGIETNSIGNFFEIRNFLQRVKTSLANRFLFKIEFNFSDFIINSFIITKLPNIIIKTL